MRSGADPRGRRVQRHVLTGERCYRSAVPTLTRRGCLLCAVAAASACGRVLEGEPRIKSRSLWVYGSQPSPSELATAEDYIDRCARLLGVSLPRPIQYLWYGEPMDSSGCQGFGVTSVDTNTIEAAQFPHYHELAHILTARGGLPPLFFVEGMAEALSPHADFHCRRSPQQVRALPREWLRSAIFRRALSRPWALEGSWSATEGPYVTSALFTLTAVRAVGFDRYWRFYCATQHFAEPEEIERSFRAHTGASLDAIVALLEQRQEPLSPLLW